MGVGRAMLVISLVALPLLANAQEVSSSPADATQDRFDFTEALQPGHEALSFSVRGGEQLNIPTGPRSELHGGSAAVRFSRCHTPHRERGLEMSVARLTGGPHTAKLWALVPVQRQYFHRQSRHTGYWELGVGISHLNTLVPEQSTHTNFVEHLAVGAQWPAGKSAAWGLEGRFQHLSNAGREHPNIGLNGVSFAVTYTLYR
jgi:hypothetical protein